MGRTAWTPIAGVAVGAALLGAAWACSSPDRPPVLPDLRYDGGDSASTTDGPSACKAEDGGCNQLETCGAKVYIVQYASAAPAATGGTVVDGTYTLTDYKLYTGPGGLSGNTGSWLRQTMRITASDAGPPLDAAADAGPSQEMEWLEVIEATSAPVKNASGWMSLQVLAPFDSTIVFTCPTNPPYKSPYTATSDQLVLFANNTDGTGVLTYTKQ